MANAKHHFRIQIELWLKRGALQGTESGLVAVRGAISEQRFGIGTAGRRMGGEWEQMAADGWPMGDQRQPEGAVGRPMGDQRQPEGADGQQYGAIRERMGSDMRRFGAICSDMERYLAIFSNAI